MDNSKRISKMDAILFALSLELLLLQLRIWEGSSNLRASTWKSLNRLEQRQRDKLVRDRETIKDVIRRTLIELAETGRWTPLQKALPLLEGRILSVRAKKTENEKLYKLCEEVSNQLISTRNQWSLELHNADQRIATLRDKMKDEMLNASTRLLYADLWLSARAEAQELKFRVPREPLPRIDQEERVHTELCKVYELQIQEREKTLEYWRIRYADDTVTMNERLAVRREELRAISALRAEKQALFDLHEGEMRAWLTFKRQRAERLERERRNRNAATRIQAWWRGVMVRRALGSFRYLKNVKKSPTKSKKK